MPNDIETLKMLHLGPEDAYERLYRDYFPLFEQALLGTFPMLVRADCERCFKQLFKKLCKQLRAGDLRIENGQVHGLELPLSEHLLEGGRQRMRRSIVDGRTDKHREDHALIRAIEGGEEQAVLLMLYRSYRAEFIPFARKYCARLGEGELLDAYQDSLLIFLEKIRAGKLRTAEHWIIGLRNDATVQTAIFSIGRNKVRSACRRRRQYPEEWAPPPEPTDTRLLSRALGQLPEKCRRILIAKYWHDMRMAEIAEMMGYKNEAVARQQKRRCVLKLRKIYDQMKDDE